MKIELNTDDIPDGKILVVSKDSHILTIREPIELGKPEHVQTVIDEIVKIKDRTSSSDFTDIASRIQNDLEKMKEK